MPDTWSLTSDEFSARDGLQLARYLFRPAGEARAAVAVVHGYGEHGGRYRQLAGELAASGFCVCVYDLRGHGRSAGRRGHVGRFKEYLDDTGQFVDWARLQAGACRCSCSATAWVASSPRPSWSSGAPTTWPGSSSRLRSCVWRSRSPRTSSSWRTSPRWWCRRWTWATPSTRPVSRTTRTWSPTYRTDPLNHTAATARWATEVFSAQRSALSHAGRITLDLLVMAGADDPVAHPDAARELFAAARSRDKKLLVYPGLLHEIFNEVEREAPVADLRAWLEAHLPEA